MPSCPSSTTKRKKKKRTPTYHKIALLPTFSVYSLPGPAREKQDAQICPCGKAVKSTTRIVAECELYKEEQDAVRDGKIDECDLEKFGTL